MAYYAPENAAFVSRPVWGAWIEIRWITSLTVTIWGRAPYGARGLKSKGTKDLWRAAAVAPRMGRVD